MAGVYIIAESMTANGVLRMVLVAAVYGLEHAVLMRCGRSKLREVFWNVTGLAVFLLMMAAFYSDASLALWNMALCGAAFAGFMYFSTKADVVGFIWQRQRLSFPFR